MGPCVERSARGSGKGPCAALATGTHRARARKGVLRTVPSTPRRCATAGVLPEYSRPRAARVRARQCDGACGRTQGRSPTPAHRSARTQAHGTASRARRAHRAVSCLSSDSESGTVPSSEFEAKSLRRAWFVPLCSEMRTHRSVPRTHTSTARGGRIGSSSERVLDTGTRGGAARVPSSCPADERYSSRAAVRTHLPWYMLTNSKAH